MTPTFKDLLLSRPTGPTASYGENDRLLVPVAGPFSNLPDDLKVLVGFLTRTRAMRLLHQLDTTLGQALALNRNALVQKFGHLVSLLWARLILGRFRDVVSHLPFEAATNAAEVPNDEDPHHLWWLLPLSLSRQKRPRRMSSAPIFILKALAASLSLYPLV